MHIVAFTSSVSDPLARSRFPRIELSLVVPVDRNVENSGVVVEDLRRSIANMDIPVEDNHFLDTVLFLGNSRRNTHIIIHAEAGNDVIVGVMSRGSNNCKGLINLHLGADGSDSLNGAATRDKCRLGSVLVHVRVRIRHMVLI